MGAGDVQRAGGAWRGKGRDGTAHTVISEPKKDGTAPLIIQIIGTATLDDNVAAKETWTAITERFARRSRTRGPSDVA